MYSSKLQINPMLLRNNASNASNAIRRIAAGISVVRRDGNPNRDLSLTFQHLGKLNPLQSSHLQDLADCWRYVISDNLNVDTPLIIGLAESGIVPAFAMYHACTELSIRASWCHSSRDFSGEIAFTEPHSHAPRHFLSATKLRQGGYSELWIIDDEITTGATLVNLIEALSRIRLFRSVRIFALLDNRTFKYDSVFHSLAYQLGISINVISLISIFGNLRRFTATSELGESKGAPIEFVWGEFISESLPALLLNPEKRIQQVTLSRWLVDGHAVRTHAQISECYSIYNVCDEASISKLRKLTGCLQ